MTKADLLKAIDERFEVGNSMIGITYILGSRAWVPVFKTFVGPGKMEIQSKMNRHIFVVEDPKDLIKRYDNHETINNDSVNLLRLGQREMLNHTFEYIKSYCEQTNQKQKLRAFPWYQFSRLIRNSLSHDFQLNFEIPEWINVNGKKKKVIKMLPDQSLQFSDKVVEFKQ